MSNRDDIEFLKKEYECAEECLCEWTKNFLDERQLDPQDKLSVPVPENIDQAEAMLLVAQNYLSHNT